MEVDHWDIDPPGAYQQSWVGGSTFDDPSGHGTHVAGTIMGNGDANKAYKGMAEDSNLQSCRILYWDDFKWTWDDSDGNRRDDYIDAMEWLAVFPQADIVHCSPAYFFGCGEHLINGTDDWSRKADEKVYECGQIYVAPAGNSGNQGDSSIWAPGCAKNVITVGAVKDFGY